MMNRLQVRHILYPMDWSPMSMNALHWANAMARAQEAELRAFHVVAASRATIPERLGFLERDLHMVRPHSRFIGNAPHSNHSTRSDPSTDRG
jgi:nucleotide-binding universal stress UspA family protein